MSKQVERIHECEDLIRAGIKSTRDVLRQIADDVTFDPDNAFTSVKIGTPPKKALRVDIGAEDTFARVLHRYRQHNFSNIEVYGEERLRNANLDLSSHQNMCVLVDALDGTDLLERGLGNWCTASVFFCPSAHPGDRIRAAIVGLPTGEVYYASSDTPGAWVEERDGTHRKVKGSSRVKELKDASICYYGQKRVNFTSLFASGLIQNIAKQMQSKKMEPNFRIYNLAGIPMIMRLIDKLCAESHGIDAVIDLEGQKPHDIVAGAFIALMAGAVMKDRATRKDLTIAQLEQSLLKPANPDHELKYVLGATEDICNSILNAMNS